MIVNNYSRPMSHKPFGLLLTVLFASVPAAVFGQSNPRQGPEINAAEILASSTLDLPDPTEAAEFDKTFSQPFPINDGIQRNYVLATDELYQPTADGVGQIIKLTKAVSASEVAQISEVLNLEYRAETHLVFYDTKAWRNPSFRHTLSRDVVVPTANKDAALRLAEQHGVRLKYPAELSKDHLFLTTESPAQALSFTKVLREHGFSSAQPAVFKQTAKRFLPNDPLFPDQWHIRGRGQNGAKKASDARITPVWEQQDSSGNLIRGTGIVIGINDDGVEMNHPDLSANIRTNLSYNFVDKTSDPSPSATDFHGTAVAGVAAAVGYNGIGVSGAAPSAGIAVIKGSSLNDAIAPPAMLSQTGSIRVSNNSWGPPDDGQTIRAPGSAMQSALRSSAESGTITIWSAGNGLLEKDNANYDGYANSIYVLSIAAVNDYARQCDYSESGANNIISAPSGFDGDTNNAARRTQGTATTDRLASLGYNTGVPLPVHVQPIPDFENLDYTNTFNGTSSAAPVVSGVTALVLQANFSLNWRDVKEIYIRSATRNDSGDSDWARNGAGFWFNHKYGAGLINAAEAVRLAKNWSNLGSMSSVSIPLSSLPANIRDNNSGGLVKYFDTRSLAGLRVEHATLTVNIPDLPAGEQVIELTSPAGTKSVLSEVHNDTINDYAPWTFSTVHNWGEDSRGLWKLKIADRVPGNTGTLNSATLTLYGTAK